MSEKKKEKASDYPTAAGYRDWLKESEVLVGESRLIERHILCSALHGGSNHWMRVAYESCGVFDDYFEPGTPDGMRPIEAALKYGFISEDHAREAAIFLANGDDTGLAIVAPFVPKGYITIKILEEKRRQNAAKSMLERVNLPISQAYCYRLDLAGMQKGMKTMSARYPSLYARAANSFWFDKTGYFENLVSDTWLQCCLFGSVIFENNKKKEDKGNKKCAT